MVHSGSRALGRAIRDHHVRDAPLAGSGLAYLESDGERGRAYLQDVAWALAWADASRRRMAERVAALVGERLGVSADWGTFVSCHHNHVRRETHDGAALWVHRKGAIAAAAGEPGLIPGSMGTPSFHVEGRGHGPALRSSSHGAGRIMSRTEARHAISRRELFRQLEGVLFDHRRAEALRDEAPGAYKDIRAVMRAQRPLTRVVRTLVPLLVYKGG
jgi:tRNA-splicing ligase RtcB (3'-phosphate/5'-hydroxy nucleic acid ligase)